MRHRSALIPSRIDDSRVDNRASGHLQSLGRQVPLHLLEQPLAQIVLFEQVTEAANRRLVRYRLAAEVDADRRQLTAQLFIS
jgi:hypothetical protein